MKKVVDLAGLYHGG